MAQIINIIYSSRVFFKGFCLVLSSSAFSSVLLLYVYACLCVTVTFLRTAASDGGFWGEAVIINNLRIVPHLSTTAADSQLSPGG